MKENRHGVGGDLRLEEIQRGQTLAGIAPDKLVSVVAAEMRGSDSLELTYKVEGLNPMCVELIFQKFLSIEFKKIFDNFVGKNFLFQNM